MVNNYLYCNNNQIEAKFLTFCLNWQMAKLSPKTAVLPSLNLNLKQFVKQKIKIGNSKNKNKIMEWKS